MRKTIVLGSALILLLAVNYGIYRKEQLLAHGRTVLIELAPVDPRSLMQGDYMALRYRLEEPARALLPAGVRDGYLILRVAENGVAEMQRFSPRPDPAADELALRLRVRNDHLKLASNAFFFQEGTADRYRSARYGLFRVGANGEALLTGLCDERLQRLGAADAGG